MDIFESLRLLLGGWDKKVFSELIWTSGYQDIWLSGYLDIWISGHWISGYLRVSEDIVEYLWMEIWGGWDQKSISKLGYLDIWRSDIRPYGYPDIQTYGYL